jgi:predicted nucleic acid-binding protein
MAFRAEDRKCVRGRSTAAIGLHRGESEAIVLAVALGSEALLMDDSDGIRSALSTGANVIRTPGVYRLAKERGFVEFVRPKLDDLRKAGFWLRDEHYQMILQSVDE